VKLKDGTTAALRMVHVDNLAVCLRREALHAPNFVPADGEAWVAIHSVPVQSRRARTMVACGPGGSLHDYVPFYFGDRGPMLLNLHTNRVPGYTDGQAALGYLVVSVEEVAAAGHGFVFFDGHALASFSQAFDDLDALKQLDWPTIGARQWSDTADDPDRQRRKQAEFLVHRQLPWSLVRGVAVMDQTRRQQVESILAGFPSALHRPVAVVPKWYYLR